MAMSCFSHILSPPHITTFISHSTTLSLTNKMNSVELHNRSSITISSKSRTKKTFAIENRIDVETEIAVVEIEKPQFEVSKGYPSPFGATVREDGVNFAIYSLNSLSATLCLFTLCDFHNVTSSSFYFKSILNYPNF